ncbi:hypothetical protein CY35_14G052800 [Sphagnum magellanicum]|jgi:hypothetical protein|nr:hypothetical protein CY35_14G052800 [Sphagnum magellanicum]
MDYQQQQQGGVGGGNYVQPVAEDPRYSGTQPFQANGAPESNTSAAPAPKTAYSEGGAPTAAGLGAEGQGPDQQSPAAATAGSGTSRLAAVFGNSGFGAKPLQPFPTPSRPPGAVAASEYSKRSERTEQQQQPPLGDQELGAGVAGYGDQGTAGLQQSTNTTSESTSGTVDSLESESQQQNADGFNRGPPAYDEVSNRDELEQTPAPGVVEEDQPQLGTDQVAAAHQPVEEETGPTSNLNQESNLPQEETHDPVLQESQFGADEETPAQTGAPSEQEREHAELDPALIGTAAAAAAAAGKRDETTTQQQPQFDTESAAEESLGDPTAAVQPPVEDRLDDSESVPSGELGDPVEQQTQLGTTDGVPGPTGSELDQIPPSDPVEDQTQHGTDDQLPVEDTPALGGEQETTGSAAEAGVVGTGLVGEKLDEPTQQQTQLGTGGAASEESLERGPEDGGHQQQQPGEGSWDSELHDPVLQQTQLGTESGVQEAPTTGSDDVEQDQTESATPEQQFGNGGPPGFEDSREHLPSATDPQQQQNAEELKSSSNGYEVNDGSSAPGIPNTHLPTAADTTHDDDAVSDGIPTSGGSTLAEPSAAAAASDPAPDTHIDHDDHLNSRDTNIGNNATTNVADSLKGDEIPANLNNGNELPESNEPPATADDPSTTEDDDTRAPAAPAPAPAKKGMFSNLMNKIMPGGTRNA